MPRKSNTGIRGVTLSYSGRDNALAVCGYCTKGGKALRRVRHIGKKRTARQAIAEVAKWVFSHNEPEREYTPAMIDLLGMGEWLNTHEEARAAAYSLDDELLLASLTRYETKRDAQ